MSDKKKLCPFKKAVERDYNGHRGSTTLKERFEPCAGERCMAFKGAGKSGYCKRLEPDRLGR